MDNEKIKALVQSYVDELFAHDDMSDQENIENKNDAFVMCMAFAGHIMETHCIVEKKVIQDDYADVKKAVAKWESSELTERDDYFEYGRVFGNKEVLESYFSKDDLIGKETEK